MRLVFWGSPQFAVPSLEVCLREHEVACVVTQPDRPAGRGRALTPPPVKEIARAAGVEVLQPARVKDEAFIDDIRARAADAFVVVAYGKILPPALLDVPPRGAWNLHASLLPELRGAAPIQWAVIRGHERTGAAVMRMEAGLDTGPVAMTVLEPITDNDTAGTLAARLAVAGAALLGKALRKLAEGELHVTPQDASRATWAPPLSKDDGRLRWSETAQAVCARARGVDPWPGAFALRDGLPVKLFGAKVVPGSGAPGEILGVDAGGLRVACAEGAVAFAELQLPGKQRIGADAAGRGRAVAVGQRLE